MAKQRSISASLRRELDSQESGEALLVFMTITNPDVNDIIRVVSDSVDYLWNGERYIGFWFDASLLSDDDAPPQAQIKVQNVDAKIGLALQAVTRPCRVQIDVVAASQFDQTVVPRVEIEAPAIVEYSAKHLYLTNVDVNVMEVMGTLSSWNYSQRSWPGIRATKSRCPALFI